jgi:ATP-dependent RNA helicase DOB1
MILTSELKAMKRVLRRLGYLDQQNIITIKGIFFNIFKNSGKVASEISAADEIMITELIFSGIFTKLNEHEICAILSTFVCDE